ncbi:hypothetical protein HMI54_015476 [Coelomomyces lativittatus]|nr:hypothetical protein HMI56_007275 [Coelomomyces lativittatus]KAJ1510416.1 hypothetical protein HMI55_007003 [Coelomomyces lativittatus]KAJ1512829.1 hypothetical protein HMI54_015476 [Coelomomyces lativittatus]
MDQLDQLIQTLQSSPLTVLNNVPKTATSVVNRPLEESSTSIMPNPTPVFPETSNRKTVVIKPTLQKINLTRKGPPTHALPSIPTIETPITHPPPSTTLPPSDLPSNVPAINSNLESSGFSELLGQLENLSSLVQTKASASPTSSNPPNSLPTLSSTSSQAAKEGSTKSALLTSYFMETLSKTALQSNQAPAEAEVKDLLIHLGLSDLSPNSMNKNPESKSNAGDDAEEQEEEEEEDEIYICPGCNEPIKIGDTYISALDQRYHEMHLTCCVCNTVLKQMLFEDNGKIYCELHHLEKTLPKCAFCNEFIKDRCVNALGQSFHPEHFFCSQCGVPFNESGYRIFEGKAYCEADYMAFFAPICASCSKAIASSTINALNKTFHSECFVCTDCKKPFRNNLFFPLDQLPYCEFHFHKRNGTLCLACDKPILSKYMEALGKKWHLEHFVCQSCEVSLTKSPFKDISGKPYCVPCYNRFYV